MGKRWLCLILWTASYCQLQAQDADSLLLKLPSDSILSYSDSLDIFNLIDSLLTLEENTINSQLGIRLAYSSNVLYAGQTLGIDQFGLSPGASFYHKSGAYADLSAYWSADFEPNFYMTVLSLGYLHTFDSKFSMNLSYDRYFTINNDFIQYKNALSVTPSVDLKRVSFTFNYSLYFGDGSVHRLMPSLSLNLEKKKLLGIDKVSFIPTLTTLFGNEQWTQSEIIYPTTPGERLRNYLKYGTPYREVITWHNSFGVMNYSFTLPLSIKHKNWNFMIGYTYNIPVALEGEAFPLSETSFLAAGLTYYIPFRQKKFSF